MFELWYVKVDLWEKIIKIGKWSDGCDLFLIFKNNIKYNFINLRKINLNNKIWSFSKHTRDSLISSAFTNASSKQFHVYVFGVRALCINSSKIKYASSILSTFPNQHLYLLILLLQINICFIKPGNFSKSHQWQNHKLQLLVGDPL